MPAPQTEARECSTTGSEPSRDPEQDSNELPADKSREWTEGKRVAQTASRAITGALMLLGVGLALVSAGISCFDGGRMVDLTDEGIALLQARSHDANEILPSPFGRVTGPLFWLVRHNLDAFRIAGFLILALVAGALILLLIKSRTRGRVAIAITGGIAAAGMHYAEYLRTPNYNWVVGWALGLVAIGFVILVASPRMVAEWHQWHRDLFAGSILGFGIALTLTARIHSAAGAAIVVASAWGVWLLRLRAGRRDTRLALVQVLRVTGASVSTFALWILFALVLPVGGLGPLRRDVRNGVDWLNVAGSTSTSDLGRYPEDLRKFARTITATLADQAPGAAVGLLLAVLIIGGLVASPRRRSDRGQRLVASTTTVVALMTGVALAGALLSTLARGDLHAGRLPTWDLGPTLLGFVIWAALGRLVGVASVTFFARRMNGHASREVSDAPRPRWILPTATLIGLALAVSVGSGNPMAYQLHFASALLVAALACVVCLWNGGGSAVGGRGRREFAPQLLAALLCLTFGALALRWVLDARADPYRQLALTTTTKSFRSTATGVTVELPRSQGQGLEQLERQARRAGWRPGTSLLDISPFHPLITFWLGADPPFSVYPVVISPDATESLLLTMNREKDDDLRHAWLLVRSPLLGDVDYAAIAQKLGRPWPCGYESVAQVSLGPDFVDPTRPTLRVELLRPVPSPVPRTCPATG
jgi:hypothetical protein